MLGRMNVWRTAASLLVTLGLLAACSSYGQGSADDTLGDADETEDETPPATPPGTPPGAPPGTPPATPPPGTPPPSSGFGVACPTCPGGETCIAAGCDGAIPNVCATPHEVTGTSTFRIFICPLGDKLTTQVDSQCESPTAEQRPAAAFHVPASSAGYTVTVFDSSSYYFSTALGAAVNACTSATNCGGGTGPIGLPIPSAGATLGFAPTPAASGCTTIRVEFTKK